VGDRLSLRPAIAAFSPKETRDKEFDTAMMTFVPM
jgi:hypothetical protein